jgi:hypothetical protein
MDSIGKLMARRKDSEAHVEVEPDAWDRFRQAVHVMVKAGPQHRIGGAVVKSGPKHRPAASKERPKLGKPKAKIAKLVAAKATVKQSDPG